MEEIKREDLVRHLKSNSNKNSSLNEEALDFVLWKLNEIKHEVGLNLEKKEKLSITKSAR